MAGRISDCLDDFDRVLGIFFEIPKGSIASDQEAEDGNGAVIPDNLKELLEKRAEARKAKDFSMADAIRNEILDKGYTVKDTPAGAILIKN